MRSFAPRLAAVLVPLAAAVALAAPAAPAPRAGFAWPDFAALRTRYPDAAAVMLLDAEEVEVRGLGAGAVGQRVEIRQVIALLEPSRAAQWLTWEIGYDASQRLLALDATTWTAVDRPVRVRDDQMYDVTAFPDYVMYSDVRAKRVTFPAAAANTVIEIHYRYEREDDYFVEHDFRHSIPTVLSSLALVVPREWMSEGFGVSAFGLPASPATRIRPGESELREYRWELRDLDAIPDEPLSPARSEVSPWVRLAPAPPAMSGGTWANLGRRYWEVYFAGRLSATAAVHDLAQRLAGGAAAPLEKARAITRWMRRNVRYVAIEIGIGGYQPHRASEVLERRYGDCKDQVCLLIALLREAGLDARPALVRTRDRGPVDAQILNLYQFNHMIAWLPLGEEGIWIDPTASYASMDHVPAVEQGVKVLLVGPEGGRFVETPVSPPERSTASVRMTATLDSAGTLTGSLELRGSGESEMRLRALAWPGSDRDREEAVARWLRGRCPGLQVTGVRVSGRDSLERPTVVSAGFTWPRCAAVTDAEVVVNRDLFADPAWSEAFSGPRRTLPIAFDGLEQRDERFSITPPPGFRAAPPAPVTLEGATFTCRLDAAEQDGALVVERVVQNEKLWVPGDSTAAARAEYERCASALSEPLRFRRSP